MLLQEPPEWTKEAAEALRNFLQGSVGKAALAHVAVMRPRLTLGGSDINAVALAAQASAGYERCLTNLMLLAEPPSKAVVGQRDAFPSLDDDAQWGDGRRLDEPPPPKPE